MTCIVLPQYIVKHLTKGNTDSPPSMSSKPRVSTVGGKCALIRRLSHHVPHHNSSDTSCGFPQSCRAPHSHNSNQHPPPLLVNLAPIQCPARCHDPPCHRRCPYTPQLDVTNGGRWRSCDGHVLFIKIGMKVVNLIKTISSKTTFIKNHFHSKSETTFIKPLSTIIKKKKNQTPNEDLDP